MPFVQRFVEPKYLSRTQLFDEDGKPKVGDEELQAVGNNTLCNALRQLASLVLVANDIFEELSGQLQTIKKRSDAIKVKFNVLEGKVDKVDPKDVTVPESDICTFALIKDHYASKNELTTNLFSPSTRPTALQALYEAASKTPVHVMRQLDRWRRDGHRTSRFFLCTPVLGAKRRKIRNRVDIDIETSMPAAVEELRRWTSNEALGDITVTPDCTNRIGPNTTVTDGINATDGTIASDDEGIDHKLPSPEEQLQVVALKFPAEIVAVDISGRNFERMSIQRRSLMQGEVINRTTDGDTRRRTRSRKPRNRRRNTLAGIDQKEIRDALTSGEEPSSPTFNHETESSTTGAVSRSKSSDILRASSKKESPEIKKSHFNTLKQWGKSRYDKLMNKSSETKAEPRIKDDIDDFNVYETVTTKRKRDMDKERKTHERNASISSSEKSSIHIPTPNPLSSVMNIAVKLRDSSIQRRLRRTSGNKDEPHSSSGNWSASSESGRASIGSEFTTTTQPKSTTSAATSSNSLNHQPSSVNSRRRFNNTSTSSSVTSEGTLTPDIIHDLHEDGETSSVYSCDTEGYYTSFHMDSGLKTLKEEDTPPTPLHSTSTFSNSGSTVLSAENEYELFGKGSTSTTTSSAGTVCTTLRASDSNKSLVIGPVVPERKSSLTKSSNRSPESSLERDFSDKTGTVKRSPASNIKPVVVALVHKQTNDGDVSPDSGHNTSSSPIESISSPNGVRTSSDFDFSESSDMEGPERIERIRIKTTINSSRIPSMCVITPPHSDDESENSSSSSTRNYQKQLEVRNSFNERDRSERLEDGKEGKNKIDEEGGDIRRIISTTVNGSNKFSLIKVNAQSGYATVERIDQPDGITKPKSTLDSVISSSTTVRAPSPSGGTLTVKEETCLSKSPTQPIIKAALLPLNMFGRLKTNIVNFAHKRDRSKSPSMYSDQKKLDDSLFDAGEYVTIADVRNNNQKIAVSSEESNYANDIVNKNLTNVLSGKIRDTEYVSLDELPCNENNNITYTNLDSSERKQGARVLLDAEGKVVYSSDSLRRRKGSHTTFAPGKNVKQSSSPSPSPLPARSTMKPVRPIPNTQNQMAAAVTAVEFNRPVSPKPAEAIAIPKPNSPRVVAPRGVNYNTREAGPPSPAHKKDRAQVPAKQQIIPNTIPGNLDCQPANLKGMYNYSDQILGMDTNRYLSNQYYIQRGSPTYSTLPLKKTQFFTEITSERSITPDITRGLEKNHTNSLGRTENTQDISTRNFYKPAPNQKISVPVQMPDINRLTFQSVPSNDTPRKSGHQNYMPVRYQSYEDGDTLRISPIDPRHSGGFQSSTPSAKNPELRAASNLESKLLSPKKSTMSNEELYAVIHKSKKKMNIETDDTPRASPVTIQDEPTLRPTVKPPESGYLGDKPKSRLSWSPSKGEYVDFNQDIDKLSPPNESRSRQSWACNDRKPKTKQTSTIDFKRLLLQKSSTGSPKRLSAVEQLNLSKQQAQPPPPKPQPDMSILDLSGSPRGLVNRRFMNNQPSSPNREPKPAAKILSPRSQWRFASPRSDVLSSTILEDCREDESPNSSGERKASPKYGNRKSTNDKNETSPKGMPRNNSEAKSYTTATQRLYAQRAQFFSPVTQTSSQSKGREEKECSNPPTLETAF